MNEKTSVEQEESLRDDLETLQDKIADSIAELSAVEELPKGFNTSTDRFEAKDVDFTSNSWFLRLLQVQAWLRPNAEIDIESAEKDPLMAAKAFFAEIGSEDPASCVQIDSGVLRLTNAGAETVTGRLDTAMEMQRRFQELLETLTRKQATDQWAEEWDELENQEIASEPIRAKSGIWRISDFAGKASRGLLNLNPSYQRGDVWPTRDAQKLMESILRGIPLPSIILLRPATEEQDQTAKRALYEVVDGKQRLTSILRFMGQHPAAVARVKAMAKRHPRANLEALFQQDYKKFRKAWKNATGEALSDRKESEYYFPFRLAKISAAFKGELSSLAGKYFCEIREAEIHVGEGKEYVGDVFEKTTEYNIPLIEYLNATPKQIHEVFHLYNRQGKHLNAEEIRNALFHEVDLVRLVLVASGDNPSVKDLANYIPEDQTKNLKEIAKTLDEYKFGSARYRRTKLLSWLYALLFQPSESDGNLQVKSTAKQIDGLFTAIQDSNGAHKLAEQQALIALVSDTARCLECHSSIDCWDSRFKDDDRGTKWQELQLVASLVAVFLLGVIHQSPIEVLESNRKQIRDFTAAHPRPVKTQNKTQWAFIGKVAVGLLELLKVDQQRLHERLVEAYGASCLDTLRAAAKLYEARQG